MSDFGSRGQNDHGELRSREPALVYARTLVDRQFVTQPLIQSKDDASVVIGGSYSIGLADRHSDVDVNVFLPDGVYSRCRAMADELGQSQPGGEWHLWFSPPPYDVSIVIFSHSELGVEFERFPSETLAGMENAIVLKDPNRQFERIVSFRQNEFERIRHQLIRQRTLFLRQRIKHVEILSSRELPTTIALVRAEFVRFCLELCFLLEGKAFCHLKQLERRAYRDTELAPSIRDLLENIIGGPGGSLLVRIMGITYLRLREAAIRLKADDPTLTNPASAEMARVFERRYLNLVQ